MSDTSGNLQFWQAVAGAIGAGLAAFVVGIGRRAGGLARRAPEATTSGDALQREILDAIKTLATETQGLRSDWQAKRQADEDRRRDLRVRSVDEQLDDIRRSLNINRVGQNDIKHVLGHMIDRMPTSDPQRLPAPDDRGPAADQG